jgi:hypothetical protein
MTAGLLAQMLAVDALVRRPGTYAAATAGADPMARVLATIDARRLVAVAASNAELTLARWWQPRYPGAVAAAAAHLGEAELAAALVASPAFEQATGEDVHGTSFARGLLELAAAGRLKDAPWIEEVLAYEWLLDAGLPLRAGGATPPADVVDVERQLVLTRGRWVQGGRLLRPALLLRVRHPVGAWHEGDEEGLEAEPAATLHVLAVLEDEVAEVEVPGDAEPALDLLVKGAKDAEVASRIGRKPAAMLLGWLAEAGLLAAPAPRSGQGQGGGGRRKRRR